MPRLPSSLKWLIDRRARVAGEIEKIESLLSKCQRLADEILPLKELLASIDQTLSLHEVSVDISLIPTIKSHDLRLKLPHGELTRGILLCLKLGEGTPTNIDAITAFLVARYTTLDAPLTSPAELRTSVRYRLKNLCKEGLVMRLHSGHRGARAVWILNNLCRPAHKI